MFNISNGDGDLEIIIRNRKALRLFVNAKLNGILFIDLEFDIFTYDYFGHSDIIQLKKSNRKKQYDGTYVFTIDVSKIKVFDYIVVTRAYGRKYNMLQIFFIYSK